MRTESEAKTLSSFVKQVVIVSAGFGIILFVLYWVMVSQSNQNPVKEQTKQTGRMVFTMFYTAMQNGWGEDEIDRMTRRINEGEGKLHVRLYRGPIVEALYGKRAGQPPFVMSSEDEMELAENGMIRYHYAVKFEKACLKCHTNANVGENAGMLELTFPLGEFWVSSTYVVKIITIIFVVTVFSISLVLFVMLRREFIKPLSRFIAQVDHIMSHKDLRKEIVFSSSISELNHLKNVFNKLRSELADAFEAMKRLAEIDELTGVCNRVKLNQVLAQYKESRLAAAIILFDLDKFKPINDECGHDVGDAVLKHFATVIRQNLKGRDYVFRLGGDEFMVLLPNTSGENAETVARQINEELQTTPLVTETGIIVVACSYGIASGEDFVRSFDILFREADQRMLTDKKRKHAGR